MLLNTASCTVYTPVISGTWLHSADFQPFVSTRATSSSIILFSPVSILRIIYMHIRVAHAGAKDATRGWPAPPLKTGHCHSRFRYNAAIPTAWLVSRRNVAANDRE